MASTSFKAGVAVGATAAAGGGGYAINLAVNKDKGEIEKGVQETITQDKELTPEEKVKQEQQRAEEQKQKELEKKKKEAEEEKNRQEAVRYKREGPKVYKDLNSTNFTYDNNTVAKAHNNKNSLIAADLPENAGWWKWAYDERWEKRENKQTTLDSPFENITSAFNKTLSSTPVSGPKSLNQACHEAYQKSLKDFYLKDGLLGTIKTFCSGYNSDSLGTPDWDEPNNISLLKDEDNADSTYQGKFADWGSNKNKDKLVSATPKDKATHKNEEWWIWSFMQNYKNTITFANEFKGLTSAYSETDSEPKSLNQVCKSFHSKTESITDTNLQTNIRKFCAKDAKQDDALTFTKPS